FLSPPAPPPRLYPLSLHDALPISARCARGHFRPDAYVLLRLDRRFVAFFLEYDRGTMKPVQLWHKFARYYRYRDEGACRRDYDRSEEHTSELQSRGHLVCRLLLEK